ncbi:uncharacterized protein LOC135808644 isoform X1 [Sycon ciliatum]|uniref:uncharacterized protein LOC135808644 isoform X1 n=1 Tax=Sycon ciliatum TaxID=27933 RepID=UPI0031F6FE91
MHMQEVPRRHFAGLAPVFLAVLLLFSCCRESTACNSIYTRPVSNVTIRTTGASAIGITYTIPVEEWKKLTPQHIRIELSYENALYYDRSKILDLIPINTSSVVVTGIVPGERFNVRVRQFQYINRNGRLDLQVGCIPKPLKVGYMIAVVGTWTDWSVLRPCASTLACNESHRDGLKVRGCQPPPFMPALEDSCPGNATEEIPCPPANRLNCTSVDTAGRNISTPAETYSGDGYGLLTVLASALVPGAVVFVLLISVFCFYQKWNNPAAEAPPVQTIAMDRYSVAFSDVGNLTHLDLSFSRATGIASSQYSVLPRCVRVYICYAHNLPACDPNEQHQRRVNKLVDALEQAGVSADLPCFDTNQVMADVQGWFLEHTQSAVDAVLVVGSAKLVKMWRQVGSQHPTAIDDASPQLAFYERNFVKKLTSDPEGHGIPVIPVLLERSSSNDIVVDFMERKVSTSVRPLRCYEACGRTELQKYMKDLTQKIVAGGSANECNVTLELSDSDHSDSECLQASCEDAQLEAVEEVVDQLSQNRSRSSSRVLSRRSLVLDAEQPSQLAAPDASSTTQSTSRTSSIHEDDVLSQDTHHISSAVLDDNGSGPHNGIEMMATAVTAARITGDDTAATTVAEATSATTAAATAAAHYEDTLSNGEHYTIHQYPSQADSPSFTSAQQHGYAANSYPNECAVHITAEHASTEQSTDSGDACTTDRDHCTTHAPNAWPNATKYDDGCGDCDDTDDEGRELQRKVRAALADYEHDSGAAGDSAEGHHNALEIHIPMEDDLCDCVSGYMPTTIDQPVLPAELQASAAVPPCSDERQRHGHQTDILCRHAPDVRGEAALNPSMDVHEQAQPSAVQKSPQLRYGHAYAPRHGSEAASSAATVPSHSPTEHAQDGRASQPVQVMKPAYLGWLSSSTGISDS